VVTSSPLLLGRADAVDFLAEGRVVAVGRHAELLESDPDYRDMVSRTADAEDVVR